jgi:hypothetical protein
MKNGRDLHPGARTLLRATKGRRDRRWGRGVLPENGQPQEYSRISRHEGGLGKHEGGLGKRDLPYAI